MEGYLCRVVDESYRDIPAGMTGRLIVKGPTGCRYLAGENQTDYVHNGWNVTGDLYSIDADGFYWFGGRMNDIIDNGGYEIVAPEIEEMLLEHPAVTEVSVIGRPDPEWGEVVVAYVVGAAEPGALDALCLERIARFKRPKAYVFLPALPKNNYGKVLKTELRARDAESV